MCHWPGPRSLATTNGVSVDVLSSRYLDVSVPWVRLKPPILFGSLIPSLDNWKSKTSSAWSHTLLYKPQDTRPWSSSYRRWVSPFGNPWIKASSQLPTAYRSVARPSSPQRQGIHRTPLRHLIALIINVHTLGRMYSAQLL